VKRTAISFLAVGSGLLLPSLLLGGRAGAVVLVGVSLLFPVALIALGSRSGSPSPGSLLALAVLLLGTGSGVLALSGPTDVGAGLPAATWLMLAGLWLAPLTLTCWLFASGFERFLPDRAPAAGEVAAHPVQGDGTVPAPPADVPGTSDKG